MSQPDDALRAVFAQRDFHLHTFFSPCSHDVHNTLVNAVRTAEQRGLKQIAFTDHWHERRGGYRPPKFYDRVDQVIYRKTRETVERLDTDLEVFVSCEVDMSAPGVFTLSEELAGELDYVLVTASHFHMPDVPQAKSHVPRDLAEHGLLFLRAAIEWPPTQVIAHPIGRFWAKEHELADVVDTITDKELLEVLSLAQAHGVALEMNRGCFGASDRNDEAQLRLFRQAKQAGCKVSPGSDTHTLAGIGNAAELADYAAEAGFTAEDVVDAAWLRGGRASTAVGRSA